MNEVHEPVPAQRDQPGGLETKPTESAAEQSLDLLRRERANFLNYKRRVERERTEDRERARIEVLSEQRRYDHTTAFAPAMPRHYDRILPHSTTF